MLTYPDFLRHRYDGRVAGLATVIFGLGYLGFFRRPGTARCQLMAGTIMPAAVWRLSGLDFSLPAIGVVIILYTDLGGLKAVIYTDTVQWIILLAGPALAIPIALARIGGLKSLRQAVPPGHLTLTNMEPVRFLELADHHPAHLVCRHDPLPADVCQP